MAEQLRDITLTPEQIEKTESIARLALSTVENNYGTGFPHFRGGQHNLPFHAGYHTFGVTRDSVRVGEYLGFTPAELLTTHASAAAHDIIQLKPRGVMERESAEWFEEQMRRGGLPRVMAEAGGLAIVGTEPLFKGNVLVGQQATKLRYPSKSAERVAKSVACGDFGDLYSPKGPLLSHKLYQEIKGVKPNEEPPFADLLAYEKGQVALREAYRFPLREGERLLATHRRQVMRYGEQMVRQLERGDITSWQQLEAQDRAFMRQHS